jgi:hypothetical protein
MTTESNCGCGWWIAWSVNKNLGKVGPSSIISGGIDAENGPKRGMVLPFHPLSMSFKSVSYYVDMPPVSLQPIFNCVILV